MKKVIASLNIIFSHSGVRVVCLWDNPKLHTDLGPALRSLWRPAPTQTPLLNALLTDHPTTSPHKYKFALFMNL